MSAKCRYTEKIIKSEYVWLRRLTLHGAFQWTEVQEHMRRCWRGCVNYGSRQRYVGWGL